MAVKLRLKRMGRRNASFFRLNAIDSRWNVIGSSQITVKGH